MRAFERVCSGERPRLAPPPPLGCRAIFSGALLAAVIDFPAFKVQQLATGLQLKTLQIVLVQQRCSHVALATAQAYLAPSEEKPGLLMSALNCLKSSYQANCWGGKVGLGDGLHHGARESVWPSVLIVQPLPPFFSLGG